MLNRDDPFKKTKFIVKLAQCPGICTRTQADTRAGIARYFNLFPDILNNGRAQQGQQAVSS